MGSLLKRDSDKGRNQFRTFIAAFLGTLGAGAIILSFASGYISRSAPTVPYSQEVTPAPRQISVELPVSEAPSAQVARTAAPGVVGISVLKPGTGAYFDKEAAQNWGLGTGIIVSPNGYILTNYHVAGGRNERIVVTLADGQNVEGKTVWGEPVIDLAIVKVDLTELPTIPLGDSDRVQVGEPAIAIGNPLGLQFQSTVTSGIISALNRTITIETEQGQNYMEDLIQTDASINPGNSGGPLLNSKGEVIGINTVKVVSAEGIGFAVPINIVKPVIERLVNEGKYEDPYLGVFAYDKNLISCVDCSVKSDNGVYVAHVDEKGPAYRSGIRVGCIIREVDGRLIDTMAQLRSYIYSKKPGDIINITHLSRENGRLETVSVQLGKKDGDGTITR